MGRGRATASYDALRLSQGMSRKSAVSGTRTGGAKCVIAVPADESPWPLEGEHLARLLAQDAAALAARGIVWVPDFVANAGGLLYAVTVGRDGRSREEAIARVEGLGATVLDILERAEADGSTTLEAALRLADRRLANGA